MAKHTEEGGKKEGEDWGRSGRKKATGMCSIEMGGLRLKKSQDDGLEWVNVEKWRRIVINDAMYVISGMV